MIKKKIYEIGVLLIGVLSVVLRLSVSEFPVAFFKKRSFFVFTPRFSSQNLFLISATGDSYS